MNEAKEKTALCTSVGADERQSVQNTISSISALDTEINHPDENSPENFEDILRQMQRRSIQTKTLLEVLVPLLNTLNNLNRYTWPEQEKIILELFNGKQVLIPPVLAEEMQHVLSADDDERDEIMQNLYKITDAYANWYRKKLGYPYDDSKIDKRYTATTARNEKIKGWVALIVDMVWFLCGLYTLLMEVYWNATNTEAQLTVWNAVPIVVGVFGLPFALINAAKWSKE